MLAISTDRAPSAVGPYSQAVKTGDLLFCSGQIGIDPATGKLKGSNISDQTLQVIRNIREVLLAASLDLPDIIKTTVFLSNMDDFPVVNEIYAKEFGQHRPARSTVQVAALPLKALIEIECIATFGNTP